MTVSSNGYTLFVGRFSNCSDEDEIKDGDGLGLSNGASQSKVTALSGRFTSDQVLLLAVGIHSF